ncbi:alpha/beta hydrolase [Autumnicola musiva]|uniref:Alpha/beta hydrolase n=1 Tax=Autumnicola musiva TaxID=3075589 RepID=A0ABU3D262_9FLAO|nr:alpha/beta hydrolase [Zunongwangia sp. F117]MDT0675625.1 alpha/beta hydrolase [Zunongwangia sp. F117]
MKKHIHFFIFVLVTTTSIMAQDHTLPLWPNSIPNSQPSEEKEKADKGDILWISKVQEPEIQVFLPPKNISTGQAVIICPGGGYEGLAFDWEGTQISKWLNTKGIAGIVLKYRLPSSASVKVSHEAPLQDAQKAMQLVRENADSWNINKDKVGIIGFSAGGHLASTLGTHLNKEDSVNSRPDFMALIYPVISMKNGITHQGSRNALLGDNPDKELVEQFSNETRVSKETPPTFILHATDDESVPVENSILFYKALKENNIYAEMHIYPEGGHGFSLGNGNPVLESWPKLFCNWLKNIYSEDRQK